MRINVFKNRLDELGYELKASDFHFYVRDKTPEHSVLAFVSIEDAYMLDTMSYKMEELEESHRAKLFSILSEFASTPIEDREVRYYLKLKDVNDDKEYINCSEYGKIFYSDRFQDSYYQTMFADEDIKNLPSFVNELLDNKYLIKEEAK